MGKKSILLIMFRKFKNGEVIALFPEECSGMTGGDCKSFTQRGDFRTVNYYETLDMTDPAKPSEYKDLVNHLKFIDIGEEYDEVKVLSGEYKECSW